MTIAIDSASALQRIEEIEKILAGIGHRAASIMRDDVKAQFQAGGSPAWPALTKSTVQGKKTMGYPRLNRKGMVPASMVQRGGFGPQNILMRTGALFSSWTQEHDPHHIERVSGSEVEIGSKLPYAKFHQLGGWQLPQRALRITEEAKQKVAEMVAQSIEEKP